jgi:hypothetical protein
VPLRIYPGGIKTKVAWHEVPGNKRKVDLQETLINRPYGTGRVFFSFFQALRARLLSFGPAAAGQDTPFRFRIFLKLALMG